MAPSKLRDYLSFLVVAIVVYLWIDDSEAVPSNIIIGSVENVQHRQLDTRDIQSLFHEHDNIDGGCQEEASRLLARHEAKNFWSNVPVYQTEVELMQARPGHFVHLPSFDDGNHTRGGLAIFQNAIVQGPSGNRKKPAIYDCSGSIYEPGGCGNPEPVESIRLADIRNVTTLQGQQPDTVTIYLGQLWDIAYFHSQVEILPKLAYLLPYLQQEQNPPITILGPKISETRLEFFHELLGLGKGILWEPFVSKKRYLVPKLVVPTATRCGSAQPKLMEALHQIMDERAPSMLATEIESLRAEYKLSSTRPLMVVHIRRKRKLLNHKDLMAALRERYADNFAILVFTGTESPKETAAIHRLASIVIAPHGAGLANLIYCRRGATSVIEMHPPKGNIPGKEWVNHCHERSAQALGLPYKMLVAPPPGEFADFAADIDSVMREVQLAIGRLGYDETPLVM